MEDNERQQLMQRCHDAELRARVLAECLEVIAGKFSAVTSGLVGMRLNTLQDTQSKHGARIGDLETREAKTTDTVEKARSAYESLRREVKSYGTPPAATKKDAAAKRPQQAAQANKA